MRNRKGWTASLRERFKRGGGARSVAILTLGTAVAQLLTIVATPLLSRLYTPAEFGLLAVFLAACGITSSLVTLRYETVILVPENEQAAASVFLMTVLVAALTTTVLSLTAWLSPPQLYQTMGMEQLKGWLPAALVVGGGMALITTAQNWLNRHQRYAAMAGLRVAQSITALGLGLLLGVFPVIDHGLIYAQMGACATMALLALWMSRSAVKIWAPSQLRALAVQHVNAPRYLLPTAALDVFTLQIPVILVAAWFGDGSAGQFSMAWRLLMLPISVIGAAVGQVFLQRFAAEIPDPCAASRRLIRTWQVLLGLGLLPMLVLFFYGEELFIWFLGGPWQEAGLLVSYMAPMALAMFLSSPTSGSFVILGLQKYSLLFAITTFIYRPACLWFGQTTDSLLNGLMAWVVIEVMVIGAYQWVAWKCLQQRQAATLRP